MTVPPMEYVWSGDSMDLEPRFRRIADRELVIGEHYRLVPAEERSEASHKHYFAAIHEAWKNFNEEQTERWPTSERFRKWALIKAGYADEQSMVCRSNAEALRWAAFLKPIDEYAIVVVRGSVVSRYTAKSQSLKAMGKEDFQASKDRVLELAAAQIDVTVADLQRHTEAA